MDDAPSDEELAAIVVAIEVLWRVPVLEVAAPAPQNPWRFSGRWWASPALARRERPWVTQIPG